MLGRRKMAMASVESLLLTLGFATSELTRSFENRVCLDKQKSSRVCACVCLRKRDSFLIFQQFPSSEDQLERVILSASQRDQVEIHRWASF
jgi:hypothetical protein